MPGPLEMTDIEAAGLLPRPGTKPRRGGERLAASYVNFYIANGGVVVPMLDRRFDAKVIAQLQRIFPNRRVVGVPAREILLGGGNIHCITQQIPRGRQRERQSTPRYALRSRAGK
jgi:agmatine deiminase